MKQLVQTQREYFHSGATKDIRFRLESLRKLRDAVKRYEPDIFTALKKDLNKPEAEAYVTEIGLVLEELNHAIRHVKRWSRPKRVGRPRFLFGSRSRIYPEPHGVSLIISPWNYPFQLSISPLVGAIAAGCCAVIKTSEFTPHVTRVIRQMLEGIFESNHVTVVEGGPEVGKKLLDLPFDHVFFTGSPNTGRSVMKKAAEKLIPVTLELGGKSPAIVAADAKLETAAKRLVWGKFTNSGQSCIAPDYVLVHESVKDELVKRMKEAIVKFYGERPLEGDRLAKLGNKRHFDRLCKLMKNGAVIFGGETDEDRLLIAPTLLEEVSWEDPVMQEEIFGPILPVLTWTDLDEVIRTLREKPKPLALYLFTENRETKDKVIASLPYGGGCVNDTMIHCGSPHLPFGGAGSSGIGKYHGKYSFDAFTHEKSIVMQTTVFDLSFRYPGSKRALSLFRKMMG
nr:aldehyde dehydrogenase [Staphylospora marina]